MHALKNNLHAIQFTHLKGVSQWFLVYSQSCATRTEVDFRTCSSSCRETLHSSAFTLISPAPKSKQPLCLHPLACPDHFAMNGLVRDCPLGSGFFGQCTVCRFHPCRSSISACSFFCWDTVPLRGGPALDSALSTRPFPLHPVGVR